jgi:hypothetical protein
VDNDFPGIVGEEWEWYPLQRLNSVPCCLLELRTTPPHGHRALISAHKLISVVPMPGVAETFKTAINEMTHRTDFTCVNLLHAESANLTHKGRNTSIDEPYNRWNIHLVSYDTLTSRAQPSNNSRLSHCSCSFGIFAESHQYKTKNSLGWRIATNARLGFKLQLTAMPGFHSLNGWCYQAMWQFSGTPGDPENETVMEMHTAGALYPAEKSWMLSIRTEDQDAQQDVAHCMIRIANPWKIRK